MTQKKRRLEGGDPQAVRPPDTISTPALPDAGALVQPLIDLLAEPIARRVVDLLRAGDVSGHVDQHDSPLGSRRHCSLIRTGKIPGVRVGRRYLARREDVDRYLSGTTAPTLPSPAPEGADGDAELARELGLRLVR